MEFFRKQRSEKLFSIFISILLFMLRPPPPPHSTRGQLCANEDSALLPFSPSHLLLLPSLFQVNSNFWQAPGPPALGPRDTEKDGNKDGPHHKGVNEDTDDEDEGCLVEQELRRGVQAGEL